MRTLLGIWTWFAFAAISAVGYFVCLALFAVSLPFDKTRRLTGRAIRFTGKLMCAAVPAWRFRVLEPLPASIPERCVCVSNHASNVDPFLIAHLPWEMKFLAKSILFRIPFVGWGIKIAGDIPLVRGSSASVKRAMRRAGWYVENGMPVLIFAEGTRSKTGDLLPFKDGAFRLALEKKAAILPMAVRGTVGALKKGDWKPGLARGVVRVGEPISTAEFDSKQLPELKQKTREAIEALLAELDAQGLR